MAESNPTSSLERTIRPKTSALVVIDLQNDYCHPRGALGRAGWDLSYVHPAVRKTIALVDAAHASGLAVVFVRTEHGPWTDSENWRGRYKDFDVRTDPVCREGSWGAEFYELQPGPNDRIVLKHRYDAFAFSELELVLQTRGLRTLVFAGVATNVCVETTIREAFVRDYAVVLLEDCTASYVIEEHRAAVHNVRKYFGLVASSAEVAEIIARWPRDAETTLQQASSKSAAAT